MSTPAPLKVLVSGTGIAGAVLTYWLLRAHPSIQVTLIERDPSPRLTGASIDIRDAAVDIIKFMGVEPQIRSKSTKEAGVQFVTVGGGGKTKVVATISATGRTDVQSITSEYEIFRGELAGIFMEQVRKIAGERVEIAFGEEVADWVDLEDGEGVEVKFKNGREMGRYDLLVGADGFGSRIRGMMLKTKSSELQYDEGVHVAYFTMDSDLLNGNKYAQWYNTTRGRVIFLRPSPDGLTRANLVNVTTTNDVEAKARLNKAWREGNDAYKKLMEEQFHDAGWLAPQVLSGMHTASDFYCSLFGQIRCPSLHSNRVVLLGDAGYATPGFGTSLAIMGGYVLAGEILRSLQPQPPTTSPDSASAKVGVATALQRYEDIMLPFTRANQGNDQAPQYLNPQTAWGISVRNIILGLVTGLRIDRLVLYVVAMLGIGGGKLKLEAYEWNDVEAVEK